MKRSTLRHCVIAAVCLAAQVAGRAAAAGTAAAQPSLASPLQNYAQGGVVVDGIAYFTADDLNSHRRGRKFPDFDSVMAFDARTLRKVRSYPFDLTYDSSPLLFQKRDGTWLIIAHEHTHQRTTALRRDSGQLEWRSPENEPGELFFGYSIYHRADGSQLLLMACKNGLHAISGETGEEVWSVAQPSTGGVTPCVDQKHGWVFYQGDGKLYKIGAEDGKIIHALAVPSPNFCVAWNTVLVDDANGYYVATRWFGKPEWDSAIRVYDRDLKLVWEHTGLPNGKKDTLTYADGRLLTGSGNHWSRKYTASTNNAWKVLTAYSIRNGATAWTCDLSKTVYESLSNIPYYNGFFYAETNGGKFGPSHLIRIRSTDGKIVEDLNYGFQLGSCAPCIIGQGRVLSGCLRADRVMVTRIAENSHADWPGPFGDPQTNQFALQEEPGATLAPMAEIGLSPQEAR